MSPRLYPRERRKFANLLAFSSKSRHVMSTRYALSGADSTSSASLHVLCRPSSGVSISTRATSLGHFAALRSSICVMFSNSVSMVFPTWP